MRVLLITWACDADDVSEPEISARWVREISKDHEVTVFSVSKPERYGCVTQQYPDLDVIEWSDIRVPRALERFRAIVKPGYLPYYIRARSYLKQLVKSKQFDIIHHLSPFAWRYPSPATGLGIPLIRGPVAGGLKTPIGLNNYTKTGFHPFMFLRQTDKLRMKFDPLLRASFKACDHVLYAAPYMQKFLSPLPIQHASVEIEHGLEALPTIGNGKLPLNETDANSIQFLFVGRIIPTKGLIFAIKALGQAKNKALIQLNVVGDGDSLASCKAEANKLGLDKQINFMGWKTKEEVARQYQEADAFIFPSFREPTGGVILEAMSYGLPIICCAYGGPDFLADDWSAIKVKPGSIEEYVNGLSEAIDTLASDKELRRRFSEAARRRALDVFSWSTKRQRINELYQSIARKNNFKLTVI